MAAKLKAMKLLQEAQGLAEVTNRRPQPRTPGLSLLQMRSQFLHATAAREKRTLSIDMQAGPENPLPIKIKHLGAAPALANAQAA
jgi:hypothetical protein